MTNVATAATTPAHTAGDFRSSVIKGSSRNGMMVSLLSTRIGNSSVSTSARRSSVRHTTMAIAQKYAASAIGVPVTSTVTRLDTNALAPSSASSIE